MRRILLVEPAYNNKYPPMGLMRISTYHKMMGDSVLFMKGISKELANIKWDRIYITTLFTFDFNECVMTINYYKTIVDSSSLFIGGVLATLMPDEISKATGISRKNILTGLFIDTSVVGDKNRINVNDLHLDYDILEEVDYRYKDADNYFAYTTRGCPNKCPFCAVPIIEPEFMVTSNIVEQVKNVDKLYGPKKKLILLDNNILNTTDLKKLVDDLCSVGFEYGAKFIEPSIFEIVMMRYHRGDRAYFLDRKLQNFLELFKKRIRKDETLKFYICILKKSKDADDFAQYMIDHELEFSPIIKKYQPNSLKARYIDFNQGVDCRRINDENMEQLSRLAISPLRIAFDDISLTELYIKAVRTAHRHGIKELSNYILFNYKDKPEDLYKRLRINIELNRELGIKIYSFPMKYSPIDRTDRSYVGEHWNIKSLRAISAILQVTKGVVAAGSNFFYRAYGNNVDEFNEILALPREYIMFRSHFENTGETAQWKILYNELSVNQKSELMEIVSHQKNTIKNGDWPEYLKRIMYHYVKEKD